MSEIDAAEVAELYEAWRNNPSVRRLLEALEKARGERTTPGQSDRLWRQQVEITEAQRDSSRALLRRSRPFLGDFSPETDPTLLSDIDAELGPKP